MAQTLALLRKEEGRNTIDQLLGLKGTHIFLKHPDAIFVSIDFESANWIPQSHVLHGQITEAGLAFLDPRAIRNSKSQDIRDWMQQVRTAHLRINETAHLWCTRSDRHGTILLAGDKFEFGCTTPIDKVDIKDALADLLHIPDEITPDNRYRDVILVAHAWGNEDKYLEQINFSYAQVGTIVGVLDTQILEATTDVRQPGLLALMRDYGIKDTYRHNGGNDAVYTVAVLCAGALSRYRAENPENCAKVNGDAEEGLTLLKKKIAAEVGGRCEYCKLFGHKVAFCEKLLRITGKDQPKDTKVRTVAPRVVKALIQSNKPFKADIYDESEFPGLGDLKAALPTPSMKAFTDSNALEATSGNAAKGMADNAAKGKKKGKKFTKKINWENPEE